MKTALRHAFLLVGAACILAPCLHAQSAGDRPSAKKLLEVGRQHHEAHRYGEAVEILRQAFLLDPGNIDINFELGLAAAGMDDHETASMAFDRILMMDPNNQRVKVELARTYFYLKLYDLSESLFREVLDAEDVPPNVQRNVKAYLGRIADARKRSFLSGALTLATVFDSNARVSPASDVEIPGFTSVTIPVIRDEFLSETLALKHMWRFRLLPHTWGTSLTTYNAQYDEETDLDINYINFATGPRFSFGKSSLTLRGTAAYMAKDYNDYLRTVGLSTELTTRLDEQLWWRSTLACEDRTYPDTPGNDGANLALTTGPVFSKGPNTFVARLGYEANYADDAAESYDRLVAIARFDRTLPWRTMVSARYKFEQTLYDRPGPYSSERRRDDVHELMLRLRKTLAKRLTAEASCKFTESFSNIGLYDYDRRVVSLSMTYTF